MGEKTKAEIWFEKYFAPCAGSWGAMYEVVREHLSELDKGGWQGAHDWFTQHAANVSTDEMQRSLRARLDDFVKMTKAAEKEEE